MSAAAPTPRANQGEPVVRYDARAKVTGEALYASDVAVKNPGYAYLVTSAIARGKITGFDDAAAKAVPGVVLVMTHLNRPAVKPATFFFAGGAGLSSTAPLAGPDVTHAGQIVALIVADSFEAAREAAHRLVVRTDAQAPAADFGSPGATSVSRAAATKEPDAKKGNALGAIASAAAKVDLKYSTPTQHHNPIELFTTTCHWEDNKLVVNEPSQGVYATRAGIAEQLGIDVDDIHLVSPYVGGGFGSKVAVGHRTALVALAAKQLGRPVKLVASRADGFSIAGYRQATEHRVRLGADKAGKFVGYQHDQSELTDRTDGYNNGGIDNVACMYAFGTVGSVGTLVQADRPPPVFMRCPAELPPMFALESAIDELAEQLGMDPVKLRQLNDTRVNPVTGSPFTSRSLNECYDEAAAKFGWAKRNPKPMSMRDGDWLIGYGCATATYPTQMMSAVARVTLYADGRAKLETAASDLGTGSYTVLQQAVADGLALPVDRVTVALGDSALPPGAISGGSVGASSTVSAIIDACTKIGATLGINGPITGENRTAAFARAGRTPVTAMGEYIPSQSKAKDTSGLYMGKVDIGGGSKGPTTQFAFGAEFVEVHVHSLTREIRVPRMVGAFAAGRILNTRTARSQLMGGMIWGLSSALHEATEIDRRDARVVNDNLGEYLVPVNADVVDVDVILVPETDTKVNPAGVKGIGELGNCGTAAAIANAVYHATGKRIRDLPIVIDKLI